MAKDHHGSGLERHRKMDFWLTRVKAHYELAGRRPPVILINFLWTYAAGGGKGLRRKKSIDSYPMTEYTTILDQYRAIGWDIAVINVGAVADMKHLRNNPRVIFDDMHHPSCSGSKLIADMLKYVFYTNLAGDKNNQCTAQYYQKQWHVHNTTKTILPPIKTTMAELPEYVRPLWDDLFREDAKVGSLTPWVPRVENATNLQIEGYPETAIVNQWAWNQFGKSFSSRDDRKRAFRMPKCDPKENQTITLLEPDFKWIGLSLMNMPDLKLEVNGVPIQNLRKNRGWNKGIIYIEYWINLKEYNLPKAEKYDILFCNRNPDKNSKVFFAHFVGVMVPETPPTTRQIPPPPPAVTTKR